MTRYLILGMACGLALGPVPASADGCKLNRIATIPAHLSADDTLLLDGSLNGTPAPLQISTYLGYTAVTASAVRQFSLPRSNIEGSGLFFYGRGLSEKTVVAALGIGSVTLHNETLPVLPAAADRPDATVAVLGGPLLRQNDLEVDAPGGAVYLYERNGCSRAPVYWAPEWFELPLQVGDGMRPYVYLTLDGKQVRAVIDTGTARSVLTAAAAHDLFGLDGSSPGMQTLGTHIGADGFSRTEYRYDFGAALVGGITFHNLSLDIWPIHQTFANGQASHINAYDKDQPDMFLGMRELKRFHFYIDYANAKMYFTLAQAPKPKVVNG
jgi:hypothetical protein